MGCTGLVHLITLEVCCSGDLVQQLLVVDHCKWTGGLTLTGAEDGFVQVAGLEVNVHEVVDAAISVASLFLLAASVAVVSFLFETHAMTHISED